LQLLLSDIYIICFTQLRNIMNLMRIKSHTSYYISCELNLYYAMQQSKQYITITYISCSTKPYISIQYLKLSRTSLFDSTYVILYIMYWCLTCFISWFFYCELWIVKSTIWWFEPIERLYWINYLFDDVATTYCIVSYSMYFLSLILTVYTSTWSLTM
jgi:hypothetical protein